MPKVPQSRYLPFHMKQQRNYTCIPTNIATILISAGITKATDPSDYLQKPIDGEFMKELFFQMTISFGALENSELFPTQSKLGKHPDFHGCKIHAQGDFGSFQQWWRAVYEHIRQGSYVLLSMNPLAADPHVVAAYEIDGDTVNVYNPDPDQNARTTWTKTELDQMWGIPVGQSNRLNHDILVVTVSGSGTRVSVSEEEKAPSST